MECTKLRVVLTTACKAQTRTEVGQQQSHTTKHRNARTWETEQV
jgi:hypothetical protein